MPITLYANIADDSERARFRESSAAIRAALRDALAGCGFEIEALLIGTRRSFSLSQTAAVFDVHPRTIRRLVDSGELEAFRVRGCLRISASSIEQYRREQILAYQLQRDE